MFNVLLFLCGVFLVISSEVSITGSAIGPFPTSKNSLLGFYLIIFSCTIFLLRQSLLHEHKLTSRIGHDAGLVRLAESATRNPVVQEELNRLTKELAEGNTRAGLGTRHVQGTDISYMRGPHGGRLFYRERSDGYEIVAKSSKDERIQDAVMGRLRQKYHH